jgi:hypothetical protein
MEQFSAEPDRARMRASNAERDEALRSLAAHYAEGRLDQPEFDRRAEAALTAATQDQLRRLFADLPARDGLDGRDEPATAPERSTRGWAATPGRPPWARRVDASGRPTRPGPPLPVAAVLFAVLLTLAVAAVLHGAPPFPLIPLIFILSRRRRRWN